MCQAIRRAVSGKRSGAHGWLLVAGRLPAAKLLALRPTPQFATHSASMQASPAAHVLATVHCGAASPGVTQKPSLQTLAA